MSEILSLNSVELAYPIYSIRAQSLRNTIASLAVGGKLLKDGKDVIHIKALSGVTFTLKEGDRLGVVGHNGAGKTTLLKVIAGIYEPDRGHIQINGRTTSMIDVGLGLDRSLTGRENIITMGRMRGFTTKQVLAKMEEIIDFSELGPYIDLPMKTYSTGMGARLVFSVATSLDPDILVMDEWLGAGDASFVKKAGDRMKDILGRARCLVLGSHNFNLIRDTCNKLVVLHNGTQIYFGDTAYWDFKNFRAKE
ncbi:MAG: ABC transporter ATP-binding protein [Asticcacaulis sp.]|nr:ABC transporter ATP-binding protein [Asticcacaulis sp.]